MLKIYADHAATTPMRKEVIEAMLPYMGKKFGNASSIHSMGEEAKEAIERARKTIAKIINAEPEEIIFTSGGTESDNLAIKGIAMSHIHDSKTEIITSGIEHDAVLEPCRSLNEIGFKTYFAKVNKEGIVDIVDLKSNITKKTCLVSVMHANNEIGTIQPIEEIGKICKQKGITFHTDAVQTFCKEDIDVKKMNIDLLSASSHKIYGPKGVGFLYIKKGTRIAPLLNGGGQEFNIRSGTENVFGIVGFAKAAELAAKEMKVENARLKKLRNKLIKGLVAMGGDINGSLTNRLSNNINVSFNGIEGESIILILDKKGIEASTGSACSSRSLEPSHVLLALGLTPLQAHGSVRFSLGKSNTEKDVNYILKTLPPIINNLRKISPIKQ